MSQEDEHEDGVTAGAVNERHFGEEVVFGSISDGQSHE